ncbi:MAG: hypothetical protein WBM08_03420, partial [Prochlorococcaceae cyanobacterium]
PQLSAEGAALAERWAPPQGADPMEGAAAPGTVLERLETTGLVVATGGCPLLLRAAQLEGKRSAAGQALLQQLGAEVGERLGEPLVERAQT